MPIVLCVHVVSLMLLLRVSCDNESLNFWFVYILKVPVGRATLGRIMNVLGEPIDERGEISEWSNP